MLGYHGAAWRVGGQVRQRVECLRIGDFLGIERGGRRVQEQQP